MSRSALQLSKTNTDISYSSLRIYWKSGLSKGVVFSTLFISEQVGNFKYQETYTPLRQPSAVINIYSCQSTHSHLRHHLCYIQANSRLYSAGPYSNTIAFKSIPYLHSVTRHTGFLNCQNVVTNTHWECFLSLIAKKNSSHLEHWKTIHNSNSSSYQSPMAICRSYLKHSGVCSLGWRAGCYTVLGHENRVGIIGREEEV